MGGPKELSFFVEIPFVERDYQRFGIARLRERGFDVDVIDLTRLVHPDYTVHYRAPHLSRYAQVVSPRSWDDVEAYVGSKPHRFGIMTMGYDGRMLRLYRIFKRHDYAYAAPCFNLIPRPSGRSLQKLLTLPGRMSAAWWMKKWRMFAFRVTSWGVEDVQYPRCVLRGSRRFVKQYPGPADGPRMVWAHTLDYDLFLQSGAPRAAATPYAVFLDEYLPFHPDYLVDKDMDPHLDPADYYGGLDRFFRYVEQRTGLQVVIAEHPRALYEGGPDYFRGRRLERGKTVELVRDSALVLTHASTAINFALLYRKPLIMMTTRRFDKCYEGGNLWCMAELLGKKPVYLDGAPVWDLARAQEADEALRRRYVEDYIKKSGTPEKPFWDIVADFLDEEVFRTAGAESRHG